MLLIAVPVSIGLLIASMLIAGLETRIADFIGQGCLTTVHSINEADKELAKADGWLRNGVSAALAAMTEEGIWVGWRIAGAWLYLGASIVSCIGDVGLLLLTFGAMGLTSGESPRLGAGVELLSVVAYLGSATIFGLLLLDCLGITHFGPWPQPAKSLQGKFFFAVALLGLAISAAVGGIIGLWRGLQVVEADWGGDALLLIVSGAIPFSLVVAVALGFWALASTGASIWVAALFSGVICLSLVRAPLRIASETIRSGYGILASGLALAAAPGRSAYGWLYSFEGLRTRLHLPPMAPPARSEPSASEGGSPPDNAPSPADRPPVPNTGSNAAPDVELEAALPGDEFVPAGVGQFAHGRDGSHGYVDDIRHYDPFSSWEGPE